MIKLETRLRRELQSIFNLEMEVTIKESGALLILRVDFRRGENKYTTSIELTYNYLIAKTDTVLKELSYNIIDKLIID